MITRSSSHAAALEIRLQAGDNFKQSRQRLEDYLIRSPMVHLSRHPGWLTVLERSLGHSPYCLEAIDGTGTRGFLALACVRSKLFGRFLVSLPYVNYGGIVADDEHTAELLIDRAVELAKRLDVRYLELRSEAGQAHPALDQSRSDKVHMRLGLPKSTSELWDKLPAKVRNQIRKAQKSELTVAWGREDLLKEYYAVFSENMRDLGTPVYSRRLFLETLREFGERAEFCVVRASRQPVASAMLLHGWGVTEVPSASSLRRFNHTCANMLLYWNLLERAIQRHQTCFDFGRSTKDSNTFRFKKQWGAEPIAAEWQYFARCGSIVEMRRDNPRYLRIIRTWQSMPLWLTRLIGPHIVRGIP
jgi:FemAB-related protein (PEP-CTERM system-associated)